MKGARKIGAPAEYTDWMGLSKENWKPSYPFNERLVREAVIYSLWLAQRGLCVYCGRKLDMSLPGKTFHIEHFRPQATYKELEVAFDNLFLSCGQEAPNGGRSQTCGTRKDKWFDEAAYVQPIYPDCMDSFTFSLNGDIKGATTSATKMIEVLNLNHDELVKEREQFLKVIDSGHLEASDFWDNGSASAESYAHMVFKHFGETVP
jgi:uncharacterized protein (TIGR02646 family)